MKPYSDNWVALKDENGHKHYQYRYDSGPEAVVWKEGGRWQMSYTVDAGSPEFHADLGRTFSPSRALERAELVIEDALQRVSQTYRDIRTLVNLAKEIKDVSPPEQAAIERMAEALQENPMFEEERLASESTEQLRSEVREAYAEWQADIDNDELEFDYFDKMDRLDHNLAERGLERGEDIDEELPLRELPAWADGFQAEMEARQEQERSTDDKGYGAGD